MSDPSTAYLASVPEKDVQETIREAAERLGYVYYHVHDSRRDNPGFPDCVLLHPATGAMFVIECKRERGRLSRAQVAWLAAFSCVRSIRVDVARPSNLEQIVEQLRAGAA